MSGSNEEFDFAVVGGGIVGASIAFGIAGRGRRVVMLDEGDVALRASRGNFALVWLHSKGVGMPDYARWTRRSIALWPSLAAELKSETGIDVALEQRGGFLLYLDQDRLAAHVRALGDLAGELGEDRFPYDVMDHAAIARMLPAIGPDVVGGTFCPLEGHVNVLRLLHALHEACRGRNVSYRPHATVTRIEQRDGHYVVETGVGRVTAERVVLAAGLGNAPLAPMVDLAAPVSPERGQILVTEKLDRFVDYPLGTLRQTDEGSVMIGASKENAGFDTGTRADVLRDLASDAVRMFPRLARARIVRTWSALRVMSPDGFPIYDRNGRPNAAFLVTCHSGVTLAGAHAMDLAPQLADGVLPDRFNGFSARRYGDVSQAA